MLNSKTSNSDVANKATRDGFGDALFELGAENQNIVALTADLTESTRVEKFAKAYPQRFFNVGVAEQNLMGVSAGLALSGMIPFAASYAVFSPGRNWDQLRVSVCYSNANVKIIGGHAGLSVGPDGATHQALEDIALTAVLPNLTVIVPCDYLEAKKATKAIAKLQGPCYLRTNRDKSPLLTSEDTPFEIGKANILREGSDVTIVGTGMILTEAVKAAKELEKQNISVEIINLHTIKPLDKDTIISSLKKTKKLITLEEHQTTVGLGSIVAKICLENQVFVPLKCLGMNDQFGQSGTTKELWHHYKMDSEAIVEAVKKIKP